jgi:chemosensory pili system protein ChpA (sensor histidine kinase/response regulator)
MTLTAAPPSLAVEPKAISITQYEALTSDIEIAKQQAVESFDYEDPKGDKAARSYIAGLRKIRSRIESARKEAKSYALEYGRAVDAQAKAIEAEILGLIEPHQQALDGIAQREKARVAGHEQRLQSIIDLVREASAEGTSSTMLNSALTWLEQFEFVGMEEFQEAAEAEIANGLRLLEALHMAAAERERREFLEAAEAQRLAEEEQARQKAEAEARQAEAVERARQEAAAEAARSVAEAERRAKESEVRAAAAEQLRQQQEAARQQDDKRRAQLQQEAEEFARRAAANRRNEMAAELSEALARKTCVQVVEALLDGTLHRAVSIDWAKA